MVVDDETFIRLDFQLNTLISGFRRDVYEICGHCPETSVNNYHTTPRNTLEDRRFLVKYSAEFCKTIIPTIFIPKWKRFTIYTRTCVQLFLLNFPSFRQVFCRQSAMYLSFRNHSRSTAFSN
jgi:hypothetical protein